jgi:hypothetical protein
MHALHFFPPGRTLTTLALLGLLTCPLLSWALPEAEVRSQTNANLDITALPSQPQALLTITYTCPHQGRIHALVTGRLNQAPLTHFQPWFTQLSIARNSLTHASGPVRAYLAPTTTSDSGEQDIALQHFATCDARQVVTYRLLANKGRDDQRHPLMLDAEMSLLFIAIGTP